MKVLFIAPFYYPAIKLGGPVESIHALCKQLVKDGLEITVLTTNLGIDENVKFGEWCDVDGVKVKYFKYLFYKNFTFSLSLFLEALKIIKNYDLVYIAFVWNFTTIAGVLASILNKKKYILSPRGTLYKEAVSLNLKIFKKLYLNTIGKIILNCSSAIHFTSEDEREKVSKYLNLKSKSFVVPNGIDLNLYKKAKPLNNFKEKYELKRYVLFLGRLHPKKGLDILIPAFSLLSKDYTDLVLVLAGPDNDNYKNELDKMIKSNMLVGKVLFPGMLVGDEKASAYMEAEIFVLPSYSENFGMSVIESMIYGALVVVSSNVALAKEISENNAGYVSSLDAKSLYTVMKKALENDNKAIIANASRLVLDCFSITGISKIIEKEFISILNP